VAYGLTSSLHGGRSTSGSSRSPASLRGIAIFGVFIAGGWLLPGRKRVLPYSIQWLKRLRPVWFRQDLTALLHLLREQRSSPHCASISADRGQAGARAARAGGITGKIVLVGSGSSLESRAA
jgi:NADPH2:quinone reductase